jgi:hypothetical protein
MSLQNQIAPVAFGILLGLLVSSCSKSPENANGFAWPRMKSNSDFQGVPTEVLKACVGDLSQLAGKNQRWTGGCTEDLHFHFFSGMKLSGRKWEVCIEQAGRALVFRCYQVKMAAGTWKATKIEGKSVRPSA